MGSVLVVDDEIDICTLVTRQLKSIGIKAEYALSIKEALSKTAFNPYDLYIIDLNLTDGSGFTLGAAIKGGTAEFKNHYHQRIRQRIEKSH